MMTFNRNVTSIPRTWLRATRLFPLAAASLIALTPSAKAEPPVSCGGAIARLLDANIVNDTLSVAGARLTARGVNGFAAFAMRDGFQIETTPLHTSASRWQNQFFVAKSGTRAYTGRFHLVFTDRGNGSEERWQVWIDRTGRFWLGRSGWSELQSVTCFEGTSGQVVVIGHIDNPGFGTDFWSLVMRQIEID